MVDDEMGRTESAAAVDGCFHAGGDGIACHLILLLFWMDGSMSSNARIKDATLSGEKRRSGLVNYYTFIILLYVIFSCQ
jgi:hypothetical protein